MILAPVHFASQNRKPRIDKSLKSTSVIRKMEYEKWKDYPVHTVYQLSPNRVRSVCVPDRRNLGH